MKINGPLGVASMYVQDFMGIQDVRIEVQQHPGIIVLTGKNGSGKSSMLTALWVALGGTANMPEIPIRVGANEATIQVVLSDDDGVKMIVERRMVRREDGTVTHQLKVKNGEGLAFPAPAETVKALLGVLSFDPLAFTRMKAADQAETLRKLVGLDFTAIDAKRKRVFEERREIGREVLGGQHALTMMQPPPSDTPDEEVDPAEIAKELDAAREAEARERNRITDIEDHRNEVGHAARGAEMAQGRIEAARRALAEAEAEHAKWAADIAECERRLEAAQAIPPIPAPDTAAIMAKIADVQRINQNVARKRSIAAKRAEVERAVARQAAKTAEIEAIDDEKAKMIAEAKMPLEGLGFGDGMVLYKGLPFAQASSAQQLEVSTTIAAALNPTLRTIRINDGALLDTDAMERLLKWAVANDFQIFMERVGAERDAGVIILEEGHIQGVEPRPREAKPVRGSTAAEAATREIPGVKSNYTML